jgi:hypothetical protein
MIESSNGSPRKGLQNYVVKVKKYDAGTPEEFLRR